MLRMKIGAKLIDALSFLLIYIQISFTEITKEDGICYFPGSNPNTILEENNLKFPVPVNTSVNYKCFYNDTLIQGSDSVQCLEDGSWSGELPTCGDTTSKCKSSELIEKVIFIDGDCIHFSRKIRLNFTEATKECKKQVNGEIITAGEKKLLTLTEYANASIRYYWIQTPQSMQNQSNGSTPTETLFWQTCSAMKEDKCCSALSNDLSHPLVNRDCIKENAWICLSAPTGCGYPDRKPITLMNITKWKEKSPIEVKYYCPEGLTLEGDETRECKENGSWTGEAPSCINIADSSNESISSEGTDETTISLNDAAEEMEHRWNVYIITGIGTLAAVLFVVIGFILYQRKKKRETRPIHYMGPAEVTSFDSETLVSTEELYEEINLDRRDDFKFDDDGYVSTDEVKRNEGEYSCVNSDKIKKTLALPTLNEERHSHLEDQNSFDMCNLPGASVPKEDHFVMVENDLYKCSDNSDTAESD